MAGHFRLIGDCMAVDNHLIQSVVIVQEVVADPEQIALLLIFKGYARANPGVNKKIVANGSGEFEGF